jgi:alpha-glucoside transport system substrate-binding protein
MLAKRKLWSLLSLLVVLSLALAACRGGVATEAPPTEEPEPVIEPIEAPEAGIDCMGAQAGDKLTMLYQWSGNEEAMLNAILKPLVDACGIQLAPESTRDHALLDTRVKAGTPPDVAFWTSSALDLYQDQLVALDQVGGQAGSYAGFWREMGTRGGKWVGLVVKADIKSIIWYSPVVFEAFGYEVPETWAELDALVEQMVADGNVPWSMGMESGDATGWTGSDFIQDILLVTQGPEYVMGIIDGSVPYNDAGVQEAYQIYGQWAKDPKYTVGGAGGTVSIGFLDAIYKVFSDPPEAMMVKQSGFAGGEVAKQYPDLEYGMDYDFFGVPGAKGLQGGTDFMMVFEDTPAVKALVAYLTSEAGAQRWAEVGFDLSPNKYAIGSYTDVALAKKAEILAGASGFTPDIGDTVPGGFGSAEWKAIVDYINDAATLDAALAQAAAVQEEALGGAPAAVPSAGIDCMGAQAGDKLTMLYQWSGNEEAMLNAILKPLVDACGIQLAPESTRDHALLDTRVKAGTPPDVAFWTSSALDLYQDQLVALDQVGGQAGSYAGFWREMGTRGGKWVGLVVKADIKSIIWYSPVVFEAFGYEVPETWAELDALVEQMVADGNVPWSMGMESGDATGWTGSDFIQDILLVTQGPEYVMGIIDGSVPYNDAGVQEAYQIYGQWAKDPKYTVGGAGGTVSIGFLDAIYKVFSDPPEAMMVKQSGFAGGEVAKQYPDLEYGMDYDFFGVPGAKGLQGGTDFMMVFEDTPAVKALVAYLTSEAGAQRWAEVGFDLSPNKYAIGSYTDVALAKKAEILAGASGFTPDIGDTVPGGFGSAEWKAIVDYINDAATLDAALAQAAAVQEEALK